jgi:hypothetical protein
MEIGHVLRGEQHRVIFRRVQLAIRAVDNSRLWQDHSAFGVEIRDREFVAFRFGYARILREQSTGKKKEQQNKY